MSELRDYQRVLVDNIMEDVQELFDAEALEERIVSRILSYDRERKEQIERDLPAAIVRAMADVL